MTSSVNAADLISGAGIVRTKELIYFNSESVSDWSSTCPYDINSSDFLIEKACFFFFDFRASGVTFYQFGLNLCVASISPVEAVDYWVVEADFVELNNKYQIRLFQWQHKKCCFTSVSSGWGHVNDQRNDRGSASLFKSLYASISNYFMRDSCVRWW